MIHSIAEPVHYFYRQFGHCHSVVLKGCHFVGMPEPLGFRVAVFAVRSGAIVPLALSWIV